MRPMASELRDIIPVLVGISFNRKGAAADRGKRGLASLYRDNACSLRSDRRQNGNEGSSGRFPNRARYLVATGLAARGYSHGFEPGFSQLPVADYFNGSKRRSQE